MDKYQIISSGRQRAEWIKLSEQARGEGRLAQATRAAKEIMAKLEVDPQAVGELLFHLKHWKLPVRHVVQAPWSIHFAIDTERRVVYLGKFALLSHSVENA